MSGCCRHQDRIRDFPLCKTTWSIFLENLQKNMEKVQKLPAKGAREARPFVAGAIFCTFSIFFAIKKMDQVVLHKDRIRDFPSHFPYFHSSVLLAGVLLLRLPLPLPTSLPVRCSQYTCIYIYIIFICVHVCTYIYIYIHNI